MATLTRSYLTDHMINKAAVAAGEAELSESEAAAQLAFADEFIDELLRMATEQLSSDTDERGEIELSVPVRLRPIPADAAGARDCIGISIGLISYHRECRGKRCGDG